MKKNVDGTDGGHSSTNFLLRYKDSPRDTIKEQRDLRRSPNKALAPKIVLGIPEKLNKRDQGTPWMRPMDYEAFHEDPRDNFPEGIVAGIEEQIKK